VSPGYGAGWVTWALSDNKLFLAWMITYQPLISLIQEGVAFQNSRN